MTPASDKRPTRRRMASAKFGDEYVVELFRTLLKVRPKRTRANGPAEVIVSVGVLYQHLIAARIAGEREAKRKARRAKHVAKKRGRK